MDWPIAAVVITAIISFGVVVIVYRISASILNKKKQEYDYASEMERMRRVVIEHKP